MQVQRDGRRRQSCPPYTTRCRENLLSLHHQRKLSGVLSFCVLNCVFDAKWDDLNVTLVRQNITLQVRRLNVMGFNRVEHPGT